MQIIEECSHVIESTNCKTRFYLFVLKNIINNEVNCNLFKILEDSEKEWIIGYFTEMILNVTRDCFKFGKEMAILIKCVENKWKTDEIKEYNEDWSDYNEAPTFPEFNEIAQILGLERKINNV